MEELRRRAEEQAEQIENLLAFQESTKGKGKGKDKNGRPRKQRVQAELPQEFRDRYAKIVKLDQDYCILFQEPPIGQCVVKSNGEWSHRRKLADGTWTCLRPGCKRVHLDVPDSQRSAAMEIKSYMEDVNQYFEEKRLEEAQASGAVNP